MKNLTLLVLSIAIMAILGSTQGALGVETPLTDYSRAVMQENPTLYYWTFNETGAQRMLAARSYAIKKTEADRDRRLPGRYSC